MISNYFSSEPGFHYTANVTTMTQKQSDYKVEQSSFTLIGHCRGRNWLNGNQALDKSDPKFLNYNPKFVVIQQK